VLRPNRIQVFGRNSRLAFCFRLNVLSWSLDHFFPALAGSRGAPFSARNNTCGLSFSFAPRLARIRRSLLSVPQPSDDNFSISLFLRAPPFFPTPSFALFSPEILGCVLPIFFFFFWRGFYPLSYNTPLSLEFTLPFKVLASPPSPLPFFQLPIRPPM